MKTKMRWPWIIAGLVVAAATLVYFRSGYVPCAQNPWQAVLFKSSPAGCGVPMSPEVLNWR